MTRTHITPGQRVTVVLNTGPEDGTVLARSGPYDVRVAFDADRVHQPHGWLSVRTADCTPIPEDTP